MLDALTLDQMRVLVAIADRGSFRAAGIYLSRAQSSISHAVASIESELQIVLFDRARRKPEFTRAGEALLSDARAVLMRVELMKARAQGMGSGVEMELTVAVDPQFPDSIVATALAALQQEYPTLAISLFTTSLGGPLQALDENRCDLAIAGDSVALPGIKLEALTYITRTAVISPDHPLAAAVHSGSTLQLEHLAEHVQAVVSDPSNLTDGRSFHVLSPRVWRTSDNALKKALILAGACWGNLPHWMVEGDLAAGRLLRLPVAEFGPTGETRIRLYLAHRADRTLGPAASSLRDRLITLTSNR